MPPPFACKADVLARESAAERINRSQSAEVHVPDIPFNDVQAGESLAEYLAGVGIPFDCPLWVVSVDEVGEDSAACSCKKMSGKHSFMAFVSW